MVIKKFYDNRVTPAYAETKKKVSPGGYFVCGLLEAARGYSKLVTLLFDKDHKPVTAYWVQRTGKVANDPGAAHRAVPLENIEPTREADAPRQEGTLSETVLRALDAYKTQRQLAYEQALQKATSETPAPKAGRVLCLSGALGHVYELAPGGTYEIDYGNGQAPVPACCLRQAAYLVDHRVRGKRAPCKHTDECKTQHNRF